MIFNKSGQVTMFVIIGLVILLAVSLVYFLTRAVSVDQPNFDTNDVSIETRPAQLLVTTCLESSMLEGLQLLGSQGGQRYPRGVAYPSYTGDSILFEPSVVPYWRYLDECGHPSGCELSQQPPLCSSETRFCAGLPTGPGSIEEQLEEYIIEDIESCIDGFSSIADQYDIERTAAEVDVDVIFAEGETRAVLNYPIILRSFSSENTQSLEQYESSVQIDLFEVYGLANEIIEFAKQSNYYERQTLQLVGVYGGVEGDVLIPPMAGISLLRNGAGPWILPEVQNELEQNILPHMSLIRFANTANNVPLVSNDLGVYTQYVNGFYTSFFPMTSDTIYDLDVHHQYLYEPVFVSVDDGDQLIEGKPLGNLDNPILRGITSFFIEDFRFSYDISYPLLVTVEDPDALGGQGYSFDFGIEVNVRNNEPAYQNFTYLQSFEPILRGLGDFPIPVPHTFVTRDKHTGEALPGVLVSYVCGNEYDLGVTEMVNGRAQLISELPPCEFGGFVRYQSPGYLGEAREFNNRDDSESQTFEFELWPIQEREIIVHKKTLNDIQTVIDAGVDGLFLDEYTAVTENDSIILSLERLNRTAYDTEVPLIGFMRYELENNSAQSFDIASLLDIGLENGFYTEEQLEELYPNRDEFGEDTLFADTAERKTFELVPGNYTLDATLIDMGGIYLPAETIDPEGGGLASLFVDTSTDLEARSFSSWIKGGNNLIIELTEDDVYRDNPIIFYVIETPLPRSWTELINLPNYETYLPLYRDYLQPVLYELE